MSSIHQSLVAKVIEGEVVRFINDFLQRVDLNRRLELDAIAHGLADEQGGLGVGGESHGGCIGQSA